MLFPVGFHAANDSVPFKLIKNRIVISSQVAGLKGGFMYDSASPYSYIFESTLGQIKKTFLRHTDIDSEGYVRVFFENSGDKSKIQKDCWLVFADNTGKESKLLGGLGINFLEGSTVQIDFSHLRIVSKTKTQFNELLENQANLSRYVNWNLSKSPSPSATVFDTGDPFPGIIFENEPEGFVERSISQIAFQDGQVLPAKIGIVKKLKILGLTVENALVEVVPNLKAVNDQTSCIIGLSIMREFNPITFNYKGNSVLFQKKTTFDGLQSILSVYNLYYDSSLVLRKLGSGAVVYSRKDKPGKLNLVKFLQAIYSKSINFSAHKGLTIPITCGKISMDYLVKTPSVVAKNYYSKSGEKEGYGFFLAGHMKKRNLLPAFGKIHIDYGVCFQPPENYNTVKLPDGSFELIPTGKNNNAVNRSSQGFFKTSNGRKTTFAAQGFPIVAYNVIKYKLPSDWTCLKNSLGLFYFFPSYIKALYSRIHWFVPKSYGWYVQGNTIPSSFSSGSTYICLYPPVYSIHLPPGWSKVIHSDGRVILIPPLGVVGSAETHLRIAQKSLQTGN